MIQIEVAKSGETKAYECAYVEELFTGRIMAVIADQDTDLADMAIRLANAEMITIHEETGDKVLNTYHVLESIRKHPEGYEVYYLGEEE